ncbi:MAG TPA: 2-oxoacid:acceptor oxidoreductase family protein [Candidatus Deferrimicrobium sp.]|nr:2-oxoacid:acceptor oxidoreductase family protein [Candidatus Deferrimicrobium sp.]
MLQEIRWHGRGGQGAVTAAEILAEAAYQYHDMYITASPSFGAERRGAPITASTRVSDKEIRLRSQIVNPDIVVVLDETLLRDVDVTAGLKEGGTIIVNTPKRPKELKLKGNYKIVTADATKVASDLDLRSAGLLVLNTPILGAVIKAVDIGVTLQDIQNIIKQRFPGANGEINAEATKKTYDITCFE